MKALEVTPTSWILYDDHESKIGILVKRLAKYVLLTPTGECEYKNLSELETKFGSIKFKERVVVENKDIMIRDLPVDEEEVFDIDEESVIPSYKKTLTGKARYAPGYWGVKYSNQYVAGFCPKVSTLEGYDHIGPFKDKFIINDEIAVANKRLNDDQSNP